MSIFDLDQGACTRKRVGSCQGLFARTSGDILVCSGKQGLVSACAPKERMLREIANAPPFLKSVYCESTGKLVLALGNPFDVADQFVKNRHVSEKLFVLRINGDLERTEVRAPASFDALWVTADARRFFLGKDDLLRVSTFDGRQLMVEEELRLPNGLKPWLVIPERAIALAAETTADKGKIEAWLF